MRHLAGSVTGASPFLLSGKTESLVHLMNRNCRWSYPKWILINPDLMVKGRWQTWKYGPPDIWKRIPCLVMQAAAGIICVIWTHTTLRHFAAVQHRITGTRWIFILVEQNMPWVI